MVDEIEPTAWFVIAMIKWLISGGSDFLLSVIKIVDQTADMIQPAIDRLARRPFWSGIDGEIAVFFRSDKNGVSA